MTKHLLLAGVLTLIGQLGVRGSAFNFDITGKTPGLNGLLGSNEGGGNDTSPATGIELTPGISYNDSTHLLSLHFGWGSAAASGNGVDLTSPFLGVYLQGPASLTGSGGFVYNLTTGYSPGYNATKANGVSGLFDVDNFVFSDGPDGVGGTYTAAQQEADLLAGHWYLNIATEALPGGEIRGQLTAVPEPEEYAMLAGIGLLAFGSYRRRKTMFRAPGVF